MMIILTILLVIVINITGTFLGWLLTEYEPTRISRLKWLDYKPYKCKYCLTFWIITILQSTTAILLSSITYGIVGIVLALLSALAIRIDEKNNIQK